MPASTVAPPIETQTAIMMVLRFDFELLLVVDTDPELGIDEDDPDPVPGLAQKGIWLELPVSEK